MRIRPPEVNEDTKHCADWYPENWLVKRWFGSDFMSLFVEQPQVNHHEDDDNRKKDPEENVLMPITTE